MSQFNKLFKQIILQNELYVDNVQFPDAFTFSDYGLEFIFDILPTFGPQYQWHTLEDLQNIPELVTALQNTSKDILSEISNGFIDAANAEQNESNNQNPWQVDEFKKIADWIVTIKDSVIDENADINIHDAECFNTIPNVVKQVRPRPYRRGLKALSIQNRKKFNANRTNDLIENEKPITDIVNKVQTKKNIQQPISKNVIVPAPGVERPLGLDRTEKVKTTFTNMVYTPSITQLTKQNAKKRCLAQRAKNICKQDADLQFSTNYTQEPTPVIKPVNNDVPEVKKELCIVCKEYVQPKKVILDSGKAIYECPKCGLRITSKNF